MVSGANENIGTIVKVTLGICTCLGYRREELLGKDLNLIMPKIYHTVHQQNLDNKINEYNELLLDEEVESVKSFKNKYKLNKGKDITLFAKHKARYLVPVMQKVNLIPSKNENQHIFLSRIRLPNYKEYNICYILTNNNLIIQNFTANLLILFGIDSSLIEIEVSRITDIMSELLDLEMEYSVEEDNLNERNEKAEIHGLINYLLETFKESRKITWKVKNENDNKQLQKIKKNTLKAMNKDSYVQNIKASKVKSIIYINLGEKLRKSTKKLVEMNQIYKEKYLELDINIQVYEEKANDRRR